jgi:Sulfotransferase family
MDNWKRREMQAPIFVVGPPRSGTTLTARILGQHSRIFMPGETHFFDDIYSRRKEMGDPENPVMRAAIIERLATLYGRYNEPPDQQRVSKLFSKPEVIRQLDSARDYRSMFSAFMEIQTRHVGKTRWGNNVPKDIFSIREILAFYPRAKILICIRDARDFLLSYRNKWQMASQESRDRLKTLYHPLVTSLLWKSSMKQIAIIETLVRPENIMTVRYESLVEDPRAIVRQMCGFVEEEFEEAMLDVKTHNSSTQIEAEGIFSSSVGRWRQQLTDEEIFIAQKTSGKELESLGYERGAVRVQYRKLLLLCATAPYACAKALVANREMTGPLLPYLLRRCAALFC